MVRLLRLHQERCTSRPQRFNPTMVRLLPGKSVAMAFWLLAGFNPTMVRLLRVLLSAAMLITGFNPTMVRLLPGKVNGKSS